MKRLLACFVLCLFAIACSQADTTPPEAIETAVPVLPTAAPTLSSSVSDAPNPVPSQVDAPKFVLRVWLTTDINANVETKGGAVLAAQLAAFDENHPDVELDVQIKNVAAQGGTLSYLRSGRSVAPSALPDVIVLPSDQLAPAIAESLIYPLDDLVEADGLYPAARAMSRVDEVIYGVPFTFAELYHLAYNGNVFTGDLPMAWSPLIAQERAQMMFTGSGKQGAALGLYLYLSQGGSLADGDDGFMFQTVPLTDALEQVRDGVNTGVVVKRSASMTNSAEPWNSFLEGESNVVMMDAAQFLAQRKQGNSSLYGAIPGDEALAVPVVHGWMYAISTPDTARQSISAELINWLTLPDNVGAWTQEAGRLPARPAAFRMWPNDEYVGFLQTQLQVAEAYPKTFDSAAANALSNAVVSMISNPITPQAAAEFVIQTLSP